MLLLELRLLLKTAKAANIANAAKLLLQNESEELRSKEAVVLAAEQQDYMTSEHVILLRMDGVHCHASELACPTTIRRVHLAIISTMACSRLHAREGMTAVFSTYPCCAGCSISSNDVSSSLSSSERSTSAARCEYFAEINFSKYKAPKLVPHGNDDNCSRYVAYSRQRRLPKTIHQLTRTTNHQQAIALTKTDALTAVRKYTVITGTQI